MKYKKGDRVKLIHAEGMRQPPNSIATVIDDISGFLSVRWDKPISRLEGIFFKTRFVLCVKIGEQLLFSFMIED